MGLWDTLGRGRGAGAPAGEAPAPRAASAATPERGRALAASWAPAIDARACKGCGTCVATCPSGAIRQNLFEDEEIYGEIQGLLQVPIAQYARELEVS